MACQRNHPTPQEIWPYDQDLLKMLGKSAKNILPNGVVKWLSAMVQSKKSQYKQIQVH